MAGRRTKYTPETTAKLEQAIKLGASYKLACQYAGIDVSTLEEWRKRHPDFSALLARAEGFGAIGWLAKIEKAASDGDWRAAAWKLEHRYPQEYGKTVQEVQGKDGQELVFRVVYGDAGDGAVGTGAGGEGDAPA